jgi:predicted Zn-ribbon and HTH transcriptional regulator
MGLIILDFFCQNCGYETEGFKGDKEFCPKCKCEMIESKMLNPKVKGTRTYFFRDERK